MKAQGQRLAFNRHLKKQDIVEALCSLVGMETLRVSTGSTEPKDLFVRIGRQLGLALDPAKPKPVLAREIVEASGSVWLTNYSSRGSTVTRDGLWAVYQSVHFFLGED